MTRVQIPAYTDAWMRGDRFGNVVRISRHTRASKVAGVRAALLTRAQPSGGGVEIAHVLLDKSNKVVKVILADCEIIDQNREQRMVSDYVAEGLGEAGDHERLASVNWFLGEPGGADHDEDPYGMHEERRRHP